MIPPELRFAASVIGALCAGIACGMAMMALLSVGGRHDREREAADREHDAFLRGWNHERLAGGEELEQYGIGASDHHHPRR